MKVVGPSQLDARSEGEPRLVPAVWLALVLAFARAGIVLALELVHHGDVALGGLRLMHAFPPLLATAAGLALGSALGLEAVRRLSGNGPAGNRALRWGLCLAVAAVTFLFLWGRLDDDASRRIGYDTPLGIAALSTAGLAALAVALLFAFSSMGLPRGWLEAPLVGVVLPLLLAAATVLFLRLTFGALTTKMEIAQVERELFTETWEVLRAHPEAPPRAGVLSPSAEYSPEGAARPSLILSPPARLRHRLLESDSGTRLVGAAGLDCSTEESLVDLYPAHSVRLRVRLDGSLASEIALPLGRSRAWRALGAGAGLDLRGRSLIELESELIDANGTPVEPGVPILAGFGDLALERRRQLPRTRATPKQPNIVLVVLDTLRADRTSAYGYGRATTPHLEALARRGVLFEEVCATSSWTWPSTASLLTGLYPEQHGVQDASSSFLPEHLDTLAEALQRAGFTTAAWSGSPLIVPDKSFDQGFEIFDASREGRIRRSQFVLPGALEWLESAGEWRFFLYLHLMEPHAPYVPLEEGRALFAPDVPHDFERRKTVDYSWDLLREGFTETGETRIDEIVPPEQQAWVSDLYDGCVWSADHFLGQLVTRLDELGLTENTIVAVTSDHGEELFDRGLLGHAHSLHRDLVRVPLVLAGPGLPQGKRVGTPLSCSLLGPTLARLGGGAIEGLAEEEPSDLFAANSDAVTLFSTHQGWWNGSARQPILGLRKGSTVLHFAPEAAPWGSGSRGGPGEIHLYDLAQDSNERLDLAPAEPERAKRLREELIQRLARLGRKRVETGARSDEGTLEVLRRLGYVGD